MSRSARSRARRSRIDIPGSRSNPFPQRLALADEPDRLAVGRAFLAVGLAAGAIAIGRLGGWRRCFPGSGIGRGRGGRRASGLVGDGRRGRGGRLAQAGGSGILPAGTGLVGHDVPFSCSNEISDSVEPGDHDGARCGSEFLKKSSRCCELERPFVAGVLRHREDWNRYAKRTLGKDFHQHFWDEDKRQRTERDELNQITTGMSRKHVIEGHRAEASPP